MTTRIPSLCNDPPNILVPVSGGKDSTCCLLLALELYPNSIIMPIFNDTGWEHPYTYEYLEYLEEILHIQIIRTKGCTVAENNVDLAKLIIIYNRFPHGLSRFCTKYLKARPLWLLYRDTLHIPDVHWQFWFGMRTEESAQRAKKYKGFDNTDLYDMEDLFPKLYSKKMRKTIKVRLPIVDWSTEEVFSYLKYKGVKENPLYKLGDKRVGCYPCMLSGKKAHQKVFATEFGKEQLNIIRELEKKIGVRYEMHNTSKGQCSLCKM